MTMIENEMEQKFVAQGKFISGSFFFGLSKGQDKTSNSTFLNGNERE